MPTYRRSHHLFKLSRWRQYSSLDSLSKIRQFSGSPLPPPPPPPKGHVLKWVSGILATSSLAITVHYSASSPVLCFADDGTSPAALINPPAQHQKPKFLFGDAYRRKVFFNYEKRLRMRSSPEKVFEYFASFRGNGGDIFMTPADLMRAVVPVFPPSESNLVREGYLKGERSPGELRCDPSEFFMLFDTDNNGLISFKEYIFFVTLLSIPESSFSVTFKMFDLDSNGKIDREEFKKVMTLMREHNRQGAHSIGVRAGHMLSGSVENGGLVRYFFGDDGKNPLQHDTFVQFLRDLHDEIVRLEFAHYDYKLQGTISAKDFALSMVASADLNHLSKLLDRVDDLDHEPHLRNICITLEEFKNFADLRKKLQPFSLALFSFGKVNGLLTKNDFKRAASQVCGIPLTDNVIEIVYHVFDLNHDGSLTADEFVRVLQNRERDVAHPLEEGLFSLLSSCWNGTLGYSISQFLF